MTEMKLIPHLRRDARKSLVAISKETGIPQSTIYDWLRREEGRLIKKHTAIVDYSRLGFNSRANIAIKTSRDARDNLQNYLIEHSNVNSAFRINHDFDVLVDCIFRNIKELDDFIDDISTRFPVERINVHHIVEELKEEGFLAGKDPAGEE